ncbi:hypothetical protein RHMOL_Rhmol03G0085500 [Rhododendron molle]|uniref:Uncharacterized protein n=1 Tax=Rhododendron molle TaxID=49168 RepID=A0ACC0PDF1_RHOML|nr:hypothetical protein RHMOL_Rhmol03G0085500 [Rhododendron molle]
MEKQNLLCFLRSCCFFLLPLLSDIQGVHGSSSEQYHRHGGGGVYGFHPKKLFAFGDSYADTGNLPKLAIDWQVPYGITFPGKPYGHFSDGRVLTEFLAKYLGLKSPVPYAMRENKPKLARYGMNFAYGGTGVFNTTVAPGEPNMTAQIDFFQNLLKESAYRKSELEYSLSLVTVSGNDYTTYTAEGGSDLGFPSYITRVVNQIAVNLKRIHDMGVRKVAVTAIEPVGCLPESTVANSFQQCNETANTLAKLHNTLLQVAVAKLNSESKDPGAFIILDLYDAFASVLNNKETTVKFESPILKPCCFGTTSGYRCGSLNAKGEKMYTLCDNPKATFFWDNVHPTQAGWRVVFFYLKSKFEKS